MDKINRSEVGSEFLRILWYSIAEEIVNKAIIIYELDEEQSKALKKAYLKPNHYFLN
jgi:hypothetical protein